MYFIAAFVVLVVVVLALGTGLAAYNDHIVSRREETEPLDDLLR